MMHYFFSQLITLPYWYLVSVLGIKNLSLTSTYATSTWCAAISICTLLVFAAGIIIGSLWCVGRRVLRA